MIIILSSTSVTSQTTTIVYDDDINTQGSLEFFANSGDTIQLEFSDTLELVIDVVVVYPQPDFIYQQKELFLEYGGFEDLLLDETVDGNTILSFDVDKDGQYFLKLFHISPSLSEPRYVHLTLTRISSIPENQPAQLPHNYIIYGFLSGFVIVLYLFFTRDYF